MSTTRRFHTCTRDVEFRADDPDGGDGRTLTGYAATFGQQTRITNGYEGDFVEEIARGAFQKTVAESGPRIVLQFNHGHDPRVGACPIGKIQELREDASGLFVKARLFSNDAVDPVREAIAEQAITGMSFRFRPVRDEWFDNSGRRLRGHQIPDLLYRPGDRGPLRRIVREVQLYELGPVVSPAYQGTSVGVRSGVVLLSRDTAERRLRLALAGWSDRADDEKEPYGDVTYADPGYQPDKKKRYPLDSAAHVKSAWSYINQGSNAAQYTPAQVASIKAKITSAAKKFGVTIAADTKN
ncbi:hypothetical protein AXA44_15450 [Rhodococcus sp. SC4]|nr:hypothetical protein AXA44_15450 [Rhodococcus sp. SC4]